jgi:hypothetical protein
VDPDENAFSSSLASTETLRATVGTSNGLASELLSFTVSGGHSVYVALSLGAKGCPFTTTGDSYADGSAGVELERGPDNQSAVSCSISFSGAFQTCMTAPLAK